MVARQTHNLQVGSSNLPLATRLLALEKALAVSQITAGAFLLISFSYLPFHYSFIKTYCYGKKAQNNKRILPPGKAYL